MESSNKTWGIVLISVALALIIFGIIYLFLGGQNKFVSPVPAEPSFKVIYYTPTPGPITPSSTPSATPKVKKAVTPTSAPTKAVTPTITPKTNNTPTVTPKTSPTKTP